MALKNTQYDEIMREYYRKQTEDRHEQEERIRLASEAVPELSAIDRQIASFKRLLCQKALEGDENALLHLREDIKALSDRKAALLTSHGYRPIILKCTIIVRTVRIPAISDRRNATAFVRQSLISSTPSPISVRSWRKKILTTFPSAIIPIRRSVLPPAFLPLPP